MADPLLDQAGQLLSDFARHVIRLLASCPRNCQRATDGVRGDPAYVECYALQIRATPASPSLVAPPHYSQPNSTPAPLPCAKPPKKPNPPSHCGRASLPAEKHMFHHHNTQHIPHMSSTPIIPTLIIFSSRSFS